MEPFRTLVRTRGYECDASRTVPAPVLLSFLEHLRWETMRDPALGVLEEVHAGHFFVVVEQTIEVVRRVGMGTELEIVAILERVGRSSGWVRHQVTRVSDGALVAHARVHGAWIGPNRRLARIPERMRAVCVAQEPVLAALPTPDTLEGVVEGEHAASFFAPPEVTHASRGLLEVPDVVEAPPVLTRRVWPSECDVFSHINASTYVRWIDDARKALGSDGPIRRVAIKHHREVVAGEEIEVRAVVDGSRVEAAVTCGGAVACLARLDA